MKNVSLFLLIGLLASCQTQMSCPAYSNSGIVQPLVKHKKKADKRTAHYQYKKRPSLYAQALEYITK
jgi:hypothetical protein